jgi:3-isopropylmalate/(R)-2-methylmalate dehydratase small subunit
MTPFTKVDAVMLPLPRSNIDTDQITPARYLQKPRSDNFGDYLFRDLRFAKDGSANDAFLLNQPAYRDAKVVVAMDNFGCGSSREHAVWALCDYGIRAVIAPSFGDIFYGNSLKNGLLPIVLPAAAVRSLLSAAADNPGARVTIDLEAQAVIEPTRAAHRFDIDARPKACLLAGQDEIDYTLTLLDRIAGFERDQAAQQQNAEPGQASPDSAQRSRAGQTLETR